MLRRELPSANSLFTFEAVARLRSFSDAANELNVTQPAVSRSIGVLEDHLGYKLFDRHGRWIKLTPDGDKLLRATSTAFKTVTDTLRDIGHQQESRETITITISSSAANFWFIPRIAEFRTKFPRTSLEFQMYARDNEGPLNNVDLGIRLSNPQDGDMHRWPFCDEKILALCSPEYLSEFGSLDHPKTEQRHTFIELADRRYSLDEFFHAIGQQIPENPSFIKFSDYAATIQAAIYGQGIALVWITDASRLIIDGKLVPACTQVVKTGRRYHIVASNLKPMRPVVENIRDWMIREMRNDQKKVAKILKANWDLF